MKWGQFLTLPFEEGGRHTVHLASAYPNGKV